MNFAIEDSPEQSAFRVEVRAFLDKAVSPKIEHMADPCDMSFEQYQLRRDLGRALGERGWLYPSMPKEYGGGDLSAEKVAILHDEMTRIGLALPPYYDAGGRMGAPTILVWGTEEHKKRFLPPICKGLVRTWQLLTEPGAGSDLAGIKTTAIRDGDVYVVNGQKMYVGSSHGADQSWTIVVTDPGPAKAFFAVLGFRETAAMIIKGAEFDRYMGVPGLEAEHITLTLENGTPPAEIQLLRYVSPPVPDRDPRRPRTPSAGAAAGEACDPEIGRAHV